MSENRKSFKDLGKLGKKLKGKKAALEDFVPVIYSLIDEIEKRGLEVEGILRISGSLPEITSVKKSLFKGNPGDISKMDIHLSTGLLKALLRELPEPLLLFSNYDPLLKASVMPDANIKLKVVKAIISNLPPVNREILNEVLTLAVHISHKEEVNRMTPHNIAVVLGPTVLRAQTETLETMMRDSTQVVKVVEDMIEHYAVLFENKTIEISRPVSLNPQEAEFLRKRAASLFPSTSDKTMDELVADITKLKTQVSDLETRLNEENREKEILLAFKANLDAQLAEQSETNTNLSAELESTKEQLNSIRISHAAEVDSIKGTHSREIAALESQLVDKATEIQNLDKLNSENRQQLATLKTTNSALTQKSKLLEAQISTVEGSTNEATSKLYSAQAQITQMQNQLSSAEKRSTAAESKATDLETKANKAEKALNDANRTIADLQAQVLKLEKKNSELVTNVASQSKTDTKSKSPEFPESDDAKMAMVAKLQAAEAEVGSLKDQLKSAHAKSLQTQKDLSKSESELKKAQDVLSKSEGELKKAQDDKKAVEIELKKLQMEMKANQAELSTLKQVLSDTIDNSSKAEAEERNKSAAAIKKIREERSQVELSWKKTQLELASSESQAKSLAATNATLTSEITELKALQKSHNSNLKKLQSEKDNIESEWRKLQIIKEGEDKKYQQDRAAADAAIRKVQGDKAVIETENRKLMSEKNRLSAEVDGLRQELAQQKSEVKRLSLPPSKTPEADLLKAVQENEKLANQLKQSQDDLEKTTAVVANLEKQLKNREAPSSSNSTQSAKKPADDPKTGTKSLIPASPRTGAALTPTEIELAEQLFSWMVLSLKLEALSQDRHTEPFDSAALLQSLFKGKTPWIKWPETIQKAMEGKK